MTNGSPPELTLVPVEKSQTTAPTINLPVEFDTTDSPTNSPPPNFVGPSGRIPPLEEDCEEVDLTDCMLFAIKNCLSFKDPSEFHETQTCFFFGNASENGELRRLLEEELDYHWNAIYDLKNM
jgi:hypothetical protein